MVSKVKPSQAVQTGASAAKLEPMHLGEKHNRKTIKVAPGQKIVLSLPSNPTTGAKWRVITTSRTFGHPSKEEYERTSPAGMIGGGGVQTLTWDTGKQRPSTEPHKVTLAYGHAGQEPFKVFTFSVKIVAG